MFKKFSLILFLSIVLGAFLILRPYLFKHTEHPTIEDRLPDGDFIGRAHLLDIARETNSMLYYHKVPFRDLFSHEFILSQGKLYGIDVQKPVYFFANEKGNWGALFAVSDSSKIPEGIDRLKGMLDVKDTLIEEYKVLHYPKESGFLTYGKDFLLVYRGDALGKILQRVFTAKKGDVSPTWKSFLAAKQFKNQKLVVYTNWYKLKQYGIESAMFAHDSDSTSFSLLAYARSERPIKVKPKKAGLNLADSKSTSKQLNIHVDPTDLRNDRSDPVYNWLQQISSPISFPLDAFFDAWNGDLSFVEGGIQTIQEEYITSELDENFNVTEVKKTKDVHVPGYSVLFSVNENGPKFLKKMLSKGLLRKEEDHFRFLFSPPIQFTELEGYYLFHSGSSVPKLITHNRNYGTWTKQGTKVSFTSEKLTRYELFGKIYIPVNKLIRRNRIF